MTAPPDATYAALRDVDPATLDGDELSAYVQQVAELRAWCDARQVRATRRQRELAAAGRAPEPRASLANEGRQSSRDAAAAAERERVCSTLSGFEAALAAGRVAAGHIDAVAQATKHLDEAEAAEFHSAADGLLADAQRQGVDAFARGCRDLAKGIRARHNARADVDELERQRAQSTISRWVDRQTGMHKTLIECDPVTDRQIWSAIQQQRGLLRSRSQKTGTKPSWDRLTVDALVEAVTSSSGSGGGAARPARPTLVVHTDVDTLVAGRHATSMCETDSGIAVPVDTMRRLACEADVIPIVLDGAGVVLDQGRSRRLATMEQRIALEAMHVACVHPDCTVSIDDCRIHHLVPWQLGGSTDLSNLVPVCEPHHHLVHEGGWQLTMTPDRTVTWVRPDGVEYHSGPALDRSSQRLTGVAS